MATNKASYQQLTRLLEDSDTLRARLGLEEATFMIPTDGKGLRIRVSGPKHQCKPGTKTLDCTLPDGETVSVSFEVHDDFRLVEPLSGAHRDNGADSETP